MAGTTTQQPREEPEGLHLLFVAGALLAALAAGFSLGVLLALARSGVGDLGQRWPALAQAHGHAQLAGWAGLFVMGMAYRLGPRFAGAPPVAFAPAVASFGAVALGLVSRLLGQPLAWGEAGRTVLVSSAALELAGSLLFAALLLPSLGRGLLQGRPFAPHMAAAVVWLVAAKALTVAWAPGASPEPLLVPFDRQQLLHDVMLLGFVLSAVVGVSLRSVVIFFGRPVPGPRAVWGLWLPLHLGLALHAAAAAWSSYRPWDGAARAEAAGLLLAGLGLAGAALLVGPWRPPHRLRDAARGAGTLVQVAVAWLGIGGLLLAVLAGAALADGGPVPHARLDAARHLLAVGTVTTMILGMAYLVMPAFALSRQQGRPQRWAVPAALASLPLAAVLRAAGGWLSGETEAADHLTAMAGVLAWAAVAAFALALALALRARGGVPLPGGR
ncbi:MAG TPA: hypothetical protein VNL95_00480 [Dehalococcoidia bacterium]|nr:hypothetical protein [Dehalococcoidia bacterium]